MGAFAPSADDRVADLPARLKDLQGPHVHHLLGQVSPKPDYVVWEEDALEFVYGLQRRLEKLELFPTLWRPLPKLLPSRAQLGGRSYASRTLVQRPPALRRQLFSGCARTATRKKPVFDFRARFCHSAPMKTHAFGLTLRANAPEGQKRFPISM